MARAWRPAVGASLPRTLGRTRRTTTCQAGVITSSSTLNPMKPNVAISLLFSAIFFASCSITPTNLRQEATERHTVVTRVDFKQAYRNILQTARRCYESGNIVVTGDIYTDNKTAEIVATIRGGDVIRTLFILDLRGLDAESTQIVGIWSWSLTDYWRRATVASEAWSNGINAPCPQLARP